VTQLVLVHTAPLSIHFSPDEKRFDVSGAYNIRYEIVKKRIDKAVIMGTEERLTRVGHIAIVYTHPKDEAEYLTHIEYLSTLGYLEPQVERLELAPLQGAVGLKALRAKIRYQ
jgi:hypothetical protein